MVDDILDLPEKLARKRKKPFVVIMDEFQEITGYDGDKWEKKIRAVIQHHERVGYIFAGSREHILIDMVQNQNRAFYRMGKTIFLGTILRPAFSGHIVNRFRTTGIEIDPVAADEICLVCDDYPYSIQYLCSVPGISGRRPGRLNATTFGKGSTKSWRAAHPCMLPCGRRCPGARGPSSGLLFRWTEEISIRTGRGRNTDWVRRQLSKLRSEV